MYPCLCENECGGTMIFKGGETGKICRVRLCRPMPAVTDAMGEPPARQNATDHCPPSQPGKRMKTG